VDDAPADLAAAHGSYQSPNSNCPRYVVVHGEAGHRRDSRLRTARQRPLAVAGLLRDSGKENGGDQHCSDECEQTNRIHERFLE